MKKYITQLGIALLLITAITITAAQPGKNGKKEQQKGQSDNKGNKRDKGQNKNDNNGRSDDDNNGRSDDKAFQKDNRGKGNNNGTGNNDRGNSGKNDIKGRGNHDMSDGWKWDDVSFRDRKKFRKQDKITICHKFKSNEPAVAIRVSANAVKAHMGHGDVMGECPPVAKHTFSEKYLRNRTDYYNRVQNHYEQVSYSQSILDYALSRLTGSRQQLLLLQSSNAPVADIQQKQATVVELEQNVSLLQTLLGVAANLVVNKLQ